MYQLKAKGPKKFDIFLLWSASHKADILKLPSERYVTLVRVILFFFSNMEMHNLNLLF